MQSTQPLDFVPLKTWYYEYGKTVFRSDKLLHYHTKPIQRELIEAGAMARVGVCRRAFKFDHLCALNFDQV